MSGGGPVVPCLSGRDKERKLSTTGSMCKVLLRQHIQEINTHVRILGDRKVYLVEFHLRVADWADKQRRKHILEADNIKFSQYSFQFERSNDSECGARVAE